MKDASLNTTITANTQVSDSTTQTVGDIDPPAGPLVPPPPAQEPEPEIIIVAPQPEPEPET